VINKTLSNQCWYLHLVGALALSAVIASYFDSAFAQSKIVPDTTLGAESSEVLPLESQSSRMILNEKLSFERLPTTNLWAEMDKLGSTGPAL
jgi:hypothetical protein